MIPEAAVEAACNSFWYDSDNGRVYEEEVRAALEAAAPHIAAQAWDRAVGSMVYDDGTPVEIMSNPNPYRSKP